MHFKTRRVVWFTISEKKNYKKKGTSNWWLDTAEKKNEQQKGGEGGRERESEREKDDREYKNKTQDTFNPLSSLH